MAQTCKRDPNIFRRRTRKIIRAYGEWIAEHADELVPRIDLLSAYEISLEYDAEDDFLLPRICTRYSHYSEEIRLALSEEEIDEEEEIDGTG